MSVDISCLGNHELDRGYETAKKLIDKTNCPWIISNLVDKTTKKPVLGLAPYHMSEFNDFKIGFIGFAEESWLRTLSVEIDLTEIEYIDYNETL